jgi:hypothetical protein
LRAIGFQAWLRNPLNDENGTNGRPGAESGAENASQVAQRLRRKLFKLMAGNGVFAKTLARSLSVASPSKGAAASIGLAAGCIAK